MIDVSKEICCEFDENPDAQTKLMLTKNKLTVEISHDDTEEIISNYIKSGIFNFGLDLFNGSIEQNLEVIERLKNEALKESESLGYSIPLSIYLKLSPRLQFTGKFKRNKTAVNLKLHRKVILTTNREYASRSCHSIIYVNAKFLMADVRKCDVICLGKYTQVQVVEANGDHAEAIVIVPGKVAERMQVRFPERTESPIVRVSAEELEDITFAIGTNVNVIVSNRPGNAEYCNELRKTLAELKFNHVHLFTRVTLPFLEDLEYAKWMSSAYDGFILDCSNKVEEDKVVKLSAGAKTFIEKSYDKRKPIFLQGCWSNFIDPSDYHYAFLYPDKYILPCEDSFLHLFEAVFHKLLQPCFWDQRVDKENSSSSSLFARSVAAASMDFQADAIFTCSATEEMAISISHFRPQAAIVAITSLGSVVNYCSSMHHNVLTLSFDMKNKEELSLNEETLQKLIYGVKYALSKKIVDDVYGSVILVFRQHFKYGPSDKFAVIKIGSKYEERIKNVIWT